MPTQEETNKAIEWIDRTLGADDWPAAYRAEKELEKDTAELLRLSLKGSEQLKARAELAERQYAELAYEVLLIPYPGKETMGHMLARHEAERLAIH